MTRSQTDRKCKKKKDTFQGSARIDVRRLGIYCQVGPIPVFESILGRYLAFFDIDTDIVTSLSKTFL